MSTFTSNALPTGWSVQEQTFLSTTNGIFDLGQGTQLATATFNSYRKRRAFHEQSKHRGGSSIRLRNCFRLRPHHAAATESGSCQRTLPSISALRFQDRSLVLVCRVFLPRVEGLSPLRGAVGSLPDLSSIWA